MRTKRIFSALAMLLTCMAGANATDVITVDDVIVPKGGEVTLEIGSSFETTFIAFQLDIELADGLTLQEDEDGVVAALGGSGTNHTFSAGKQGNVYTLTCASMTNRALPAGDVLMSVVLQADASLETGTVISAAIKNIIFSEKQDDNQIKHTLDDVSFNITVGEPADTRTVLDENSTTVPAAATNVDVRVKRTIKANEWSTICLPFAMSEAQVKETFGEDVDLADFDGTDSEFDGEDCVGIRANFTSVNAIEANHPYIIKVSQPVSEFTLDDVDIVAYEDEAYIEFDNGKTGSRRVVYSGFYGTYRAGTVLNKYTLFLHDNLFWYSTGETKMKAFRAYFDFLDVLTEVEEAGVKILAVIDGMATSIGSLAPALPQGEEATYNLAGQRVGKSYKGIVVENGRKTIK